MTSEVPYMGPTQRIDNGPPLRGKQELVPAPNPPSSQLATAVQASSLSADASAMPNLVASMTM